MKRKINLTTLIKRFEVAVSNHVWKGAQPPEEWEEIEYEYKMMKKFMLEFAKGKKVTVEYD